MRSSSSIPDGLPVLSRGKHRNPRRGACFMEMASVLAGERWSDHPACTHPLLAHLARYVNDRTSDDGRQDLVPLIPSVVGRLGDDRTWVSVCVAVGARAILDVPEATQRALAAGLLRADELCSEAGPGMDETRVRARNALALVPGAVRWVEALDASRGRISMKAFVRHSAPSMIRCAVDGMVATGRSDCDRLLRGLLEAGIAACPVAEPAMENSRAERLDAIGHA